MTQPLPTVHDVADALIMLAGLVAAEKYQPAASSVDATPSQAAELVAGMAHVWSERGPDGSRIHYGWLLDQRLIITEVPDPTADQLAAAILTPDAEVPS